MKFLFQLLFFCCVLSSFGELSFAQQIEGYVRTKDNEPIEDVLVNGEKSDAEGFFKTEISRHLKADTKGVVFFQKIGFIPNVVVVEQSAKNIEVIMDEDILKERMKISTCGSLKGKKVVGGDYKVFVPKGAKKKTGFDIDYEYFYVSFGKGKNKDWLDGMIYFTGSGERPLNDVLINTKKIKVRVWEHSSGISASDWSGQTEDGKYWRHFGFNEMGGNTISYSVDSKEAADFFDRIIDNGCMQIPDWMKNGNSKSN